ncbi:MAG: hypothetical protein GC151_17895 [Betaproteobacteria bacterium]|nr:hypothetical protein [Betaproteobacteria bacterium]
MKELQIADCALLPCVVLTPAVAADMPKDGPNDIQAFCSGPVHMLTPMEGQMGGSYELTCLSDGGVGTIFHGVTGWCNGAFHKVGDSYYEAGSCEFRDGSGDEFFRVYERKNQENGKWRATGGTGKYAGITQVGDRKPSVPFPAKAGMAGGQLRWWGTSKLR